MRPPPLRGKATPFGHDMSEKRTHDGHILAHRGLQLLHIVDLVGAPCLLEKPNSSMLRYLPSWDRLASRPSFKVIRIDSYAFGSPHLKGFKFLHAHMSLDFANRRCRCTTQHVKLEVLHHFLFLGSTAQLVCRNKQRHYLIQTGAPSSSARSMGIAFNRSRMEPDHHGAPHGNLDVGVDNCRCNIYDAGLATTAR